MKIKTMYILLVVVVIAVVAMVGMTQLFFKTEKYVDHTTANEGIVQAKSFHVNSDSTNWNTSAHGTVFVWEKEGFAERMRIVAAIDVDPNDWGGVAFYIPQNWYIDGITSSYPDDSAKSISSDYVSTWVTGENESSEWRAWIEIGRDRSYTPTGGGIGTVVIDLVSDRRAIQSSDVFHVSVALGADEKNGVKRMELDSVDIPISLMNNDAK